MNNSIVFKLLKCIMFHDNLYKNQIYLPIEIYNQNSTKGYRLIGNDGLYLRYAIGRFLLVQLELD